MLVLLRETERLFFLSSSEAASGVSSGAGELDLAGAAAGAARTAGLASRALVDGSPENSKLFPPRQRQKSDER